MLTLDDLGKHVLYIAKNEVIWITGHRLCFTGRYVSKQAWKHSHTGLRLIKTSEHVREHWRRNAKHPSPQHLFAVVRFPRVCFWTWHDVVLLFCLVCCGGCGEEQRQSWFCTLLVPNPATRAFGAGIAASFSRVCLCGRRRAAARTRWRARRVDLAHSVFAAKGWANGSRTCVASWQRKLPDNPNWPILGLQLGLLDELEGGASCDAGEAPFVLELLSITEIRQQLEFLLMRAHDHSAWFALGRVCPNAGLPAVKRACAYSCFCVCTYFQIVVDASHANSGFFLHVFSSGSCMMIPSARFKNWPSWPKMISTTGLRPFFSPMSLQLGVLAGNATSMKGLALGAGRAMYIFFLMDRFDPVWIPVFHILGSRANRVRDVSQRNCWNLTLHIAVSRMLDRSLRLIPTKMGASVSNPPWRMGCWSTSAVGICQSSQVGWGATWPAGNFQKDIQLLQTFEPMFLTRNIGWPKPMCISYMVHTNVSLCWPCLSVFCFEIDVYKLRRIASK